MRKWAALWLLVILLSPLLYVNYVIKGFPYGPQGEVDWACVVNHRLCNLGAAFCGLALFYGAFLFLWPTSRPLWRCSICLMSLAVLTNLANHVHLMGNVASGLRSFVSSGRIMNMDSPIEGLPGAIAWATGLQKAADFIRWPDWTAHDRAVVLAIVWIGGAGALLTGFAIKAGTWLRLRGGPEK